jgi:hypothetical protein
MTRGPEISNQGGRIVACRARHEESQVEGTHAAKLSCPPASGQGRGPGGQPDLVGRLGDASRDPIRNARRIVRPRYTFGCPDPE